MEDDLDFDTPVEKIEIELVSLDNVKKFLDQIQIFNTIETEILLDFNLQFVEESINLINPTKELKAVLGQMQMNGEQFHSLLRQFFSEEIAKEITSEFEESN